MTVLSRWGRCSEAARASIWATTDEHCQQWDEPAIRIKGQHRLDASVVDLGTMQHYPPAALAAGKQSERCHTYPGFTR